MSGGVVEAEGVLVGAVRVDASLRNADSDTKRSIALHACREIEMACGEPGREGGIGGDDDVADSLGVVDVSQNSTHCHIRLKHGIISLNITGCGEIRMPQSTVAHLQQVPLHPSRLLLLGRLSQCPLRLGDGAERAAVVVAFEYRDDLERLVERMKHSNNERRLARVHSTLSAPSSSVQHQRQRAHQSLSSPLAPKSFSTRSSGTQSTATPPSLPNKNQATHISVSKLPQLHQPVSQPPQPPSSSLLSQNPPPLPQRNPSTSAGVQRSQNCLPQHPRTTVPYSNTSPGTLDRSSSTKPALPPRAPSKNNIGSSQSVPPPPPVDPPKIMHTNDASLFRPLPLPPVGHRVTPPSSLVSTSSFKSHHEVSGSLFKSNHTSSQSQSQNTITLERQQPGDEYLDMSGNASPRGTPEQNYLGFDPVSDASARQCEEAIRELIEGEEEYISKLEGIGRTLSGRSSNFLLLEITKQAYDFHSLVLRRGMKRVHTARHLAESFVNCSEIFKIYRDLLLEYSKSLHRPSKALNLEDFLLILTKLQYYEDVLDFLSKYETGPYLLLRQALNIVNIPLVVVNSHLIFDRVDVCPISRHHHGPAVRTGWIQLTGRTPPGVAKVFTILTRTHLIFTQTSVEKERLIYTSSVRLKGASIWVDEKCLTIENTRRDKGQQQKLVYNMNADTDVEFAAWVTAISGAIHKNLDGTKPYSEC